MTETNNLIGYITPQNSRSLTCTGITCVDGVFFEDHVFLLSLMPCCGLLALPFWAKVSGRLINEREEETVLSVVVTLFDTDGQRLADYSDVIAVEAGEKGTCDVKLLGFQETADTYTIAVTDMELA